MNIEHLHYSVICAICRFLIDFSIMITLFVCLICGFFINGSTEYENQSRFCRFLLNWATFVTMLFVRVRFHVSGLEKIPDNDKYMLVSNHRSNFDPICTWYVLRKKSDISFLTKGSNLHIPFFGKIARRCCFYEIDREDITKAKTAIDKASRLLVDTDIRVGVYPEGSRQKDYKLGSFHGFVFRIAKQADVPVVVMTIRGAESIAKKFPLHRADVYIDFHTVLDRECVRAKRTVELGEMTHRIMKEFLVSQGDEE